MARLALVSRNPVMSMALTATDHDLVEVRGFDLDDWLAAESDTDVDALVLDLGSPQTALRVVGDLRAASRWIPVLLVTTHDPAWSSTEILALPGVEFLSLPLSADKLQVAVSRVLELPRTPPAPRAHGVPQPDAPLLDAVPEVPLTPEPDFLAATPVDAAPGATESQEQVRVQSSHPEPDELAAPDQAPLEVFSRAELDGMTQRTEGTDTGPAPEIVRDPEVEEPAAEGRLRSDTASNVVAPPKKARVAKPKTSKATKASKAPAHDAKPRKRRGKDVAELRLDPRTPVTPGQSKPAVSRRTAAETPPAPSPAVALPTRAATSQELVAQMLAEAEGYYTLDEAAQVIVEDAAARANAECAALLVPDGSLWRVAGGVGLRPLEHRLQLTTESWLVANIAGAGKGAIVEGSDVARNNLRGAPLASHTHLLAAPVPQVHAVLLVARERDEPFTEETLTVLAALAEESVPLVDQALKLRCLARELARHIDPWDAPAQ